MGGGGGGHGGDEPIRNQRAYKSSYYLIFILILHSYIIIEKQSDLIKKLNFLFLFVHRDFAGVFPIPLLLASKEENDGMTINISF